MATSILNLGAREECGQVHNPAALHHGNNPLPVEYEVDLIQSSSGRVGEETNFLLLPIFQPGAVQSLKFQLLSSTKNNSD